MPTDLVETVVVCAYACVSVCVWVKDYVFEARVPGW